ncbi:MAG: response regulator [Cellulosilyticaceae bacterium]
MQAIKILVSDNDAFMRKRLIEKLAQIGYEEILEARDGQEAIDLYKKHRPDLVFMDLIMPIKTGREAIEEIKQLNGAANIIVVAPKALKHSINKAIKAGARACLHKPFDLLQVKTLMRDYLI